MQLFRAAGEIPDGARLTFLANCSRPAFKEAYEVWSSRRKPNGSWTAGGLDAITDGSFGADHPDDRFRMATCARGQALSVSLDTDQPLAGSHSCSSALVAMLNRQPEH